MVADAVKDGAKKIHERYNSTKSKNEKDNGGAELKKEDISHHDGDGPSMINNEDESKDEESIIIFIPFETTDDVVSVMRTYLTRPELLMTSQNKS